MKYLSSDILSLTREAGVMIEKNRISYANSEARQILGADCVGKSVSRVFGEELAQAQASSFVGGVNIGGKMYTVRTAKAEDAQVMLFSPFEVSVNLVNDAFIYLLNDGMSVIGAGIDSGRNRAELIGDTQMLGSFAHMTRAYFRMQRLANNAASIARLNEGALSCSIAPVDLSRIYSETVSMISSMFPDVEFRTELGSGICINADYDLAQQILLNLVSNSLIHAKGRSRISVSLRESAAGVYLSVSDNGAGMSETELKNVFERYKYGFAIREMSGGAGFGMTVCAGAAKLHGGTVMIESREGHGTMVRVSFAKNLKCGLVLHSEEQQAVELKTVLTGLSDCLLTEYFDEKYMD